FDEGGVWWALNEALGAYADRKGWKQLQLNGMAEDNSWEKAAGEYEGAYQRAVDTARAKRVARPSTEPTSSGGSRISKSTSNQIRWKASHSSESPRVRNRQLWPSRGSTSPSRGRTLGAISS